MEVIKRHTNGILELKIDGVKVTGKINMMHLMQIRVDISSPYANISEDTNADIIVKVFGKRWLGHYCYEVGAKILSNLYHFATYAKENEHKIRENVGYYIARTKNLPLNQTTKEKFKQEFMSYFNTFLSNEVYTIKKETLVSYILSRELVPANMQQLFSKEALDLDNYKNELRDRA